MGRVPTYWALGRMRRLSAACSRMCDVQPMTRLDANVGVNISSRHTADVHHHAGVELDVRVQLAPGLELVEERDAPLLDFLGELHVGPAESLGDAAEQRRTRVVGLVHAVAEAHEPVTTLDRVANPRDRRCRWCRWRRACRAPGSVHRHGAGPRARRYRRRPRRRGRRRWSVITRAVNVDALNPWSTVVMRYCSTARACSGDGTSPFIM